MINKTGVIGRRFAGFYRSAQIRTANFVNQHSSLISLALFNLPLAIAGWQVLSTVKIMAVKGICWEQELKIDVAQAARQKILKDLTRLDEFGDIIAEVEPAIQDAISRAMAEINRLESRARFNRDAMTKQQDKLIEIIEKDVWQTLEPKIKDARKKERIKAWIDNMKAQLEGVDRVQETAAHVLREEVRTILYNFNEKAEDQLGQQIPGEIEGIEGVNPMHELAETIVDKIMDKQLDFDVAIAQVISEIKTSNILDTDGKETLIESLLKGSKSSNGTSLETLFADFRKKYLDHGEGKLHIPQTTKVDALEHKGTSRHADNVGLNKEDKEHGSTSN